MKKFFTILITSIFMFLVGTNNVFAIMPKGEPIRVPLFPKKFFVLWVIVTVIAFFIYSKLAKNSTNKTKKLIWMGIAAFLTGALISLLALFIYRWYIWYY